MVEHLPDGERIAEPGNLRQVLADRIVVVEPAILMQHHQGQSGELFARRCHVVSSAGEIRLPGVEIREPVSRDMNYLAVPDHDDGAARLVRLDGGLHDGIHPRVTRCIRLGGQSGRHNKSRAPNASRRRRTVMPDSD